MVKCRKCPTKFRPTAHQRKKHDFICRACARDYHRNYYQIRLQGNNPIRSNWRPSKEEAAAYRKKNKNRLRKIWRESQRRRRLDPDIKIKNEARNIVRLAVKSGQIKRLPCEKCGVLPSQAHHDNYSKPLKIRWLCRAHHQEWHRKNDPYWKRRHHYEVRKTPSGKTFFVIGIKN